jgi:hypothetical protein
MPLTQPWILHPNHGSHRYTLQVYIQQPVERAEWLAAWQALELPEVWAQDFKELFGVGDGQRASCVLHASLKVSHSPPLLTIGSHTCCCTETCTRVGYY